MHCKIIFEIPASNRLSNAPLKLSPPPTFNPKYKHYVARYDRGNDLAALEDWPAHRVLGFPKPKL